MGSSVWMEAWLRACPHHSESCRSLFQAAEPWKKCTWLIYSLSAVGKSVKVTSHAQHLSTLRDFCSKNWSLSAHFHQREEVTWFAVFCITGFPSSMWGKEEREGICSCIEERNILSPPSVMKIAVIKLIGNFILPDTLWRWLDTAAAGRSDGTHWGFALSNNIFFFFSFPFFEHAFLKPMLAMVLRSQHIYQRSPTRELQLQLYLMRAVHHEITDEEMRTKTCFCRG